jgi:type VI protein secretion system component Hcp
MKVEGFDSDVTAAGHEKWIELTSCQFGNSRHIPMVAGNMQNRESSSTSIMDVTVTGALEKAWADITKWILSGRGGKKIEIDFVSTNNNIYQQLVLHNSLMSSLSMSTGGNDRPLISASIDSTKIEYKNIKQSQEGTTVSEPSIVTYDVAAGTTS